MGKAKQIERIKSVILVVLFFLTMLLLYFFWENPMVDTFKLSEIMNEEETVEAPSVQEVTRPQEVIVNFGGGVYTALPYEEYDAWNQCILALIQFGQEETLAVEQITKEQYDQIMGFRSILFAFFYDMPFSSFCKQYQITKTQSFDQIETVTVIGFSSGSPESLFVFDEKNDKYYRLVSDVYQPVLEGLISQIEAGGYITYYSIGTLAGTGNQTIMPLSVETNLQTIEYEPEFDIRETETIRAFAQTFFGESFDFVRRITESKGTIIYMYGYGQKVLTINADGSVEYKEKGNPSGSELNYFEALDGALQFVASHGGWESIDGAKIIPYVKFATAIEIEKKKGYRFVFGMEVGGENLYYDNGEPIVVEILGGQITYYTRNNICIAPGTLEEQGWATEKEAFSAVNMIAQNYQYIHTVLLEEGNDYTTEGEGLFETVSNLIEYVEFGYVKPVLQKNGENELVPAWIVMVDDIMIYFDLYDARPLGYTNIGAS